MIRYGSHDVNDDDVASVVETLRGDWLTTGPAVSKFETDLSVFTGGVPTVAVSSGTAALHCAYVAAGLGPGDELITPPLTFIATQAVAAHLGAQLRFADVSPLTGCLDPQAVEAAINPRTSAIVAVDYAGHPADMFTLRRIATRHGLLLIEDAAHSLGSSLDGEPVGSLADITTFSFFPTKNVTTGEGGAIATTSPEILGRCREFSRQGLIRDEARFLLKDEGAWHQEVHEFGLNYRLSDILASLGSSQLKRLLAFKKRRTEIKAMYDAAFSNSEFDLVIPYCDPAAAPMWHLYPLRVDPNVRRALFEHLRSKDIAVQVNYIPAYWHPVFDSESYPRGLCPIAESYYASELSLPIHFKLSDDEILFTIESTLSFLGTTTS